MKFFYFINKDHLIGNKDLLLVWWKEARLREMDDVLLYSFMNSSLEETLLRIRSSRDKLLDEEVFYDEVIVQDPLFKIIMEASRESLDFYESIKQLLREISRQARDSTRNSPHYIPLDLI